MECATCPFGKEEYAKRTAYDPSDTELWCSKVGGKVSIFGYCNEVSKDTSEERVKAKRRRSDKRQRDKKYKARLKFLAEVTNYPQPAYYVDEIRDTRYHYVSNPKPYYKRVYRGSDSPLLKKASNKKIRHYSGVLPRGNHCHRLFDFWWEMY